MRKHILAFIVLTIPFVSMAQYNWDIGAQVGAANYLGEMVEKVQPEEILWRI